MKCERCSSEYTPVGHCMGSHMEYRKGGGHSLEECFASLKETVETGRVDRDTALARAEEAELLLRRLGEQTYLIAHNVLAAEAKLATAVEGLKETWSILGDGRADHTPRIARVERALADTLRALGIDPSKEQGK